VNTDIYHSNADPSFSDETGYFPIEKHVESIFYETIPTKAKGIIPALEVNFGLDEVEVDDAMLKFGGSQRKRHVLNVHRLRMTFDKIGSYVVDGGTPLIVMYLGIQKFATRYERIFSGIEEVFVIAGGTFFALYQGFGFIVAICSSVNFQTRMLKIILGPSADLNSSGHGLTEGINKLESCGFQFRMLMQTVCCCGNKYFRRCLYKNEEYKDSVIFYK